MTDKLDALALEVGKVQQRAYAIPAIRRVSVEQGVVIETAEVPARREPNPLVLRAIFDRIAEWEEEKKAKGIS